MNDKKSWIDEYEDYIREDEKEMARKRRNKFWQIKTNAVDRGEIKIYVA